MDLWLWKWSLYHNNCTKYFTYGGVAEWSKALIIKTTIGSIHPKQYKVFFWWKIEDDWKEQKIEALKWRKEAKLFSFLFVPGDVPVYTAVQGSAVEMPCNITPPIFTDRVRLVLYFRNDSAIPIYT